MSDFEDHLSIGAQHHTAIASYLDEIGDADGAAALRSPGVAGQGLTMPGLTSAWQRTGVKVGFVRTGISERQVAVMPASTMNPDRSLIGRKIKLSLDMFYIERYPGFGVHSVVCEFAGKNQSQGASEEVRFALSTRASDRSGSAIRGAPIFVGLTVGEDGLAFDGKTVNVGNSGDDWLINALGSESFRNGLSLVETVQPVLKPFAKLAADAVNAAARRNKNRQIAAFSIGLDFSKNATSSKLCLGSYVIVQGDDTEWAWDGVTLDTETNRLVVLATNEPLARNYMVIGVSAASIPANDRSSAKSNKG